MSQHKKQNVRPGFPVHGLRIFLIIAITVATVPVHVWAAQDEGAIAKDNGQHDPSDNSVDINAATGAPTAGYADNTSALDQDLNSELLLFEDLPIVVTAARRPQPITMSAVPITVVTSDDIHYGGLTRLEEILDFVVGVDVLQIDRNRWAVGVRGLHDFTSDRTLTLIDGRAANSPLFGGSEFYRLPIMLEDIERIEIVRGPGGAAWGANAFNGVINIIMKEPKDVLGLMASTTINEFGDTYTHLRWADQADDWSWRISAGYQDVESSSDAISGDSFESRDFSRTSRVDTAFVKELSESSKLSFGVGHSNIEQGPFEFLAFAPAEDGYLQTTRSYARIDHEFDDGATGYVQWFGNFARSDQAAITRYRTAENDLEAQINFSADNKHHWSLGGNVRYVYIDTDFTDEQDLTFGDSHNHEQWVGFFAMDRWEVSDRLTMELQARGDWYSETQLDWSGRVTGLIALDDRKRQVLRLSGAKAFRAPLLGLREVQTTRLPLPSPPLPPGLFASNIVNQPDDLENEQVYSLEVGYSATLAEGLNFRTDVYWQRYNDLIAARTVEMGLPVQTFFQLDNLSDASAYGVETELAWTTETARLSAWYAVNAFDIDGRETVRAFLPAQHKVGLTGRLFLPDDWTVNVNYKYATTTERSAGVNLLPAESFHRLDLAVAKEIFDGRGELLIGVSDLLDQTDLTVLGVGSITGHETPGRTFFLRMRLEF